YTAGSTSATLTPTAALASNTQYTATIASTVKGSDGGSLEIGRASCRESVAAALAVTSTIPANNATGVATGVVVTASFNKPLDTTTISGSSFTLVNTATNASVAATVAYTAGSTSATLTPTAALANNTQYTATIASTVKGSDGGSL